METDKQKPMWKRIIFILLKSPIIIVILIVIIVLFVLKFVGVGRATEFLKFKEEAPKEKHTIMKNPADDKKAASIDKAIGEMNGALKELLK